MRYIKKATFQKIKKEIEKIDLQFDKDQAEMRTCILLSKKCITAVHRNDLKEAKKQLQLLQKKVKIVNKTKNQSPHVKKMILQEYAEAAIYLSFAEKKQAPTLDIKTDAYLLGLCDVSGELVRYALNKALQKDLQEVKRTKEFLEEIHDGLQTMTLRQGEMRKKADKVRWDLDKVSTIFLDQQK